MSDADTMSPEELLADTWAKREAAIEQLCDAVRFGTMTDSAVAATLKHEFGMSHDDAWRLVRDAGAEADYAGRIP